MKKQINKTLLFTLILALFSFTLGNGTSFAQSEKDLSLMTADDIENLVPSRYNFDLSNGPISINIGKYVIIKQNVGYFDLAEEETTFFEHKVLAPLSEFIRIFQSTNTTNNTIKINASKYNQEPLNLVLGREEAPLNIETQEGSAIELDLNANVRLCLPDNVNNNLQTTSLYSPAIKVISSNKETAHLSICALGGASDGKLHLTSNGYADTLGSDINDNIVSDSGIIDIHSGNIISENLGKGSAISCNNNTTNIFGGSVIAKSNSFCAGIGSHGYSYLGEINIYNGEIEATGGNGAAGIGGGFSNDCSRGNNSKINISGGIIKANGGTGSAGIGSGTFGGNIKINISGGNINAYGGYAGAGIGSGASGSFDEINISNGKITAIGGEANLRDTVSSVSCGSAAAIGCGYNGYNGQINLIGGEITAIAGYDTCAVGGILNKNDDKPNLNIDPKCSILAISGGDNINSIEANLAPNATYPYMLGGKISTESDKVCAGDTLKIMGNNGNFRKIDIPNSIDQKCNFIVTNVDKSNYIKLIKKSNPDLERPLSNSDNRSAKDLLKFNATNVSFAPACYDFFLIESNTDLEETHSLKNTMDLNLYNGPINISHWDSDNYFVTFYDNSSQFNSLILPVKTKFNIYQECGKIYSTSNCIVLDNVGTDKNPVVLNLGKSDKPININGETKNSPISIKRKSNCVLILPDDTKNILETIGYRLAGIEVSKDSKLLIKSPGPKANGKLKACSYNNVSSGAGIGGLDWESSGNITIESGIINAESNAGSAGIGGGSCCRCGDIVINGGNISARCKTYNGPGIGGNGGCITINGGIVEAYAGQHSSGIGAFSHKFDKIIIKGGRITSIGGSTNQYSHNNGLAAGSALNSAEITIDDCDIGAVGGYDSNKPGYAILGNNLHISPNATLSLYMGNYDLNTSPIQGNVLNK